jgi:hypothetical protein
MRFYPFGSGSVDTSLALTASFATYALTASAATRVFTASVATNGVPGVDGPSGQCIYVKGATGPSGSTGPSGFNGTISNALPYP